MPDTTDTLRGYVNRIGLPVALAIFGLGLMASTPSFWFWVGATAFYVGAGLLALDIRAEAFFRTLNINARIGLGVIYLATSAVFSWFLILAPAPLTITTESRVPAYAIGANVYGIN